MKTFLKQLFCRHSYTYKETFRLVTVRPIPSEMIKVFECVKCGKLKIEGLK